MDKKKQSLLSLCVITKDEEHLLPNCLANIKDYVDEIVIVDTGSTDNTIQIAKKYGAKIYKKKWNNNFSQIRNYAIEKTSSKWILFLDADEIIKIEDMKKIKPLLKNPMAEGYLFYIDTYLSKFETATKTQSLRLFRNREEYRYKHRVFERIPDELLTNIKDSEITIYHYPDSHKYDLIQQLKMELLEKEVKEYPKDSYLHYVFGIELLNRKKYQESINQFTEALKYINFDNIFTPHLYKVLTLAYLQINNYTEAINTATKGLKYFPYYTDLIYYRGKSYKESYKFQQAIKDFETCIQIGDAPPSMSAETELGNVKALLALGETHAELLNNKKALNYYIQAYKLNNNFEDAIYRIGTLVKENPELGTIDSIISQYLDITIPDNMMTLIDILCLEREYETALIYINKIKKDTNLIEGTTFLKGICYIGLGELEEAEKYFSLINEEQFLYNQVLLRLMQIYWSLNDWKKADVIIAKILSSPKLKESTKRVYNTAHLLIKGKKININDFGEVEYQILAKLLEHLIYLNKINISKLLDIILQSKQEDLLIKIGKVLAINQDVTKIIKIFDNLTDEFTQIKFKENTAKVLYQNKDLKNAERILKLGDTSRIGVIGHYIWYEIWLQKTLDMINTGIRSRKVAKETKERLSEIAELITNEN